MAIHVANYQATLGWDASKFNKGMNEADSSFSSFSSKMSSIGSGIVTGIGVAITAAATSMVAFGKSSVEAGMEFDSAVSQLAATMGTTTDQIEELREKAIELGSSTSFSATEAAEGLNVLAMSGLDAEEQIAAIDDVLNLAAAGSIDMADAASYAVGAIKGFGDEFSNTQYYTDLMAKGATLAATDVNGLGEALSGSAATAASFGQSAEDTTVALLRLAEQNVTGSTAATALSRAMYDLYTPTDSAAAALDELGISAYDANGNAREFNTVVDELNAALAGMSEEEANAYKASIFTAQGLKAFNMMTVSSTEKVDEFRAGLASASDDIGAAAQQAATMLDNLEGDITIFGSAVEGLQIGVSDSVNGLMRDCVQFGTEQIGILTDAVKENGLTGLAGAVGEVLANVITKIGEYIPQLLELGTEMIKSLIKGITDNSSTIAEIAVEICTTLIEGITEILPQFVNMAIVVIVDVANAIAQQLPTLIPVVVQGILDLVNVILNNLPSFLNAVLAIIKGIAQGILNSLPLILDALPTIISGVVNFIVEAIPTIINTIVEITKAVLDYLPDIISAIVDVLVECLPVLIDGIITLIQGIVDALPDLIVALCDALPDIIQSIVDAIVELLPVIIDGAVQLILGIVDALPDIISALIDALPDIITSIIDGLVAALPQLITGLIELVMAIVEHLPEIIEALIEAIPDIIDALFDTDSGFLSADNIGALVEGAIDVTIALVEHLPEIIAGLIAAIPEIIEAIINGFSSIIDRFEELGELSAQAYNNGFNMFKMGTLPDGSNINDYVWDGTGTPPGGWDNYWSNPGVPAARGGVFKRTTHVMLGEAGTEAVVPLENNTEWINKVAEKFRETDRNSTAQAANYLADNVIKPISSIVDNIKGVTVTDIFDGMGLDGVDVALNYQEIGFSKAFESFLASAGGYDSSNNISNTGVVIRMGDITVSGVLDKDAAEQIGEMLKEQADELKDYFENGDELYSSVMSKAKKDTHFEKMVQSMTTDRLTGDSSLTKNNIKF